MKDILYIVIPSAISSFIAYLIGYRKSQTELESSRLDNLEKSIRVYNTIIEDMSRKIEELTSEVSKLELRVEELMKENKSLRQSKTNVKKYENL
jgi:predicted RNase H-like nuclease (RuvC/YqgF family)